MVSPLGSHPSGDCPIMIDFPISFLEGGIRIVEIVHVVFGDARRRRVIDFWEIGFTVQVSYTEIHGGLNDQNRVIQAGRAVCALFNHG